MQDVPQDLAVCQGTLAVELAALLSADTPPHQAKLVQRWLQQALSAFPWLRWHTLLSRQLAVVWETGAEGPQGAKRHSTPAAAVLRQVVQHIPFSCPAILSRVYQKHTNQCTACPGMHIIFRYSNRWKLPLRCTLPTS
jgi:hypothetical protein